MMTRNRKITENHYSQWVG